MREQSLAEGGALQELSHLILSAGLTLAVVAGEKASPLDGRTRVRFTQADVWQQSHGACFVPDVWPGRALQDGIPRSTNVRAASMY
jgi:hypothetical protein